MINWIALFFAGLCEVIWVVAIKYADGFTKLIPSVIFVVSILTSFGLLTFAVKNLPMGTAYAVWTGMGAAGAVIAGIVLFKEPSSMWHILFLSMIIIGIIGIKIVSPSS